VRAERAGGRRELRAGAPRAELGVAEPFAVAVGEAEVLAGLREVVQLVGWLVVAQPVTSVVGEPEGAGLGMEVEAHAVADAARDDLRAAAAREVHPRDRRVQRARRLAHVARRAHRHVEAAVGAERDELPAVVRVGRKRARGHLGPGRAAEVAGHVGEAQDPAHLGHVEGAVAEGHPARHGEAARDQVDLVGAMVAVPVHHGVHLALAPRAHEQHARRPERHLPRVRDGVRIDRDPEPGRERDVPHLRRGAREEPGQVATDVAAHHDDAGEDDPDQPSDDVDASHSRIFPRRRPVGEAIMAFDFHGGIDEIVARAGRR
jgi:hypothetical protein